MSEASASDSSCEGFARRQGAENTQAQRSDYGCGLLVHDCGAMVIASGQGVRLTSLCAPGWS